MRMLDPELGEALAAMRSLAVRPPNIAIILGSGQKAFTHSLDAPLTIRSDQIPHAPRSTVSGHPGEWTFGQYSGHDLLVIRGRVHRYEGYTAARVAFPVHLAALLGAKVLVITTASGSLNPVIRPGELMAFTDHINFSFNAPAPFQWSGAADPAGPVYDRDLLELARISAETLNLPLHCGVFCWVTGPNFETPAEIRALRRLGGDAVSMSTLPEVLAGRQRGMKVLALSLITNYAAGLTEERMTHQAVLERAAAARISLDRFLRELVGRIEPMP